MEWLFQQNPCGIWYTSFPCWLFAFFGTLGSAIICSIGDMSLVWSGGMRRCLLSGNPTPRFNFYFCLLRTQGYGIGEVPIDHKAEWLVFSKTAGGPGSKGRDSNLTGKADLSKLFGFQWLHCGGWLGQIYILGFTGRKGTSRKRILTYIRPLICLYTLRVLLHWDPSID